MEYDLFGHLEKQGGQIDGSHILRVVAAKLTIFENVAQILS
jgi:hypothetical protein